MKRTLSRTLTLLPLLLSPLPFAHGQAIPAATAPGNSPGFQLPTASGTLSYGLSASERVTFGYEGENANYYSTNFTGNLGYLSGSQYHPFSLVYSAGYLLGTNGEQSAQYHNLALSQVFSAGKWRGVVSDSISYLPESAAAGLSGIPGVGDANLPLGQLPPYLDQAILNRNVTRVSNVAAGSITRDITGKTGLSTSATYGIDRYLGYNAGIDDSNFSLSEALSHRIDARTTTGVNYSYGRYSYSGQQVVTSSDTVSVFVNRQLSRRMAATLSAGPQWINSNTALIPSRLSYVVTANVTYAGKDTSYFGGFSRGTTAGSGVVTGAITDALSAGLTRRFGSAWRGSANVAYIRSQSLATVAPYNLNTDQVVGSLQINRSISRSFSGFVSYAAERQIDNGLGATGILFNGLSQTVGFGITYAPEAIHIGHR